MGDQCVNIAKLIPLPANSPPQDNVIGERIMQMGAAAAEQLDARSAGLCRA